MRNAPATKLRDFAARCRPAVQHYANVKAQSVLKCTRGELPEHYKSLLVEDSRMQNALLAEIDAMLGTTEGGKVDGR